MWAVYYAAAMDGAGGYLLINSTLTESMGWWSWVEKIRDASHFEEPPNFSDLRVVNTDTKGRIINVNWEQYFVRKEMIIVTVPEFNLLYTAAKRKIRV